MIDVFEGPAYFHIGYDEENADCQRTYNYASIRQGELWWHDLDYFVKSIEGLGARVWMWSDKIRSDRDEFIKRVPKSVLQSNWYYGCSIFDVNELKRLKIEWAQPYVQAFEWLEKAGYDQVPTNMVAWDNPDENGPWEGMLGHCRSNIAPTRLQGVMETVWCFTQKHNEKQLRAAVDKLALARDRLRVQ